MRSFNQRLAAMNRSIDSMVCVGLDPDPQRLPDGLPPDVGGVERFVCEVIDATAEFACAFKPNLGFYLALGTPGARLLENLRERVGAGRLLIGDAKWGDIGSTMAGYARARDAFGFDAVTASPYMGWEAVAGLSTDPTRGVFMVCRSSNPDGGSVQLAGDATDPLYLQLARRAAAADVHGNCGLVLGATDVESLRAARAAAPRLSVLLPGIGAQGGSLAASLDALAADIGRPPALINASRSIIYAGSGPDFASASAAAAKSMRDRINSALAGL
jgi:orotidine-5'-phosphate decarboxylase